MEYYDLALNDLNLIRHLGKSRETFIRFTYNKNIQEKVEVGRLRRAGILAEITTAVQDKALCFGCRI
jgi:hypothetical protein